MTKAIGNKRKIKIKRSLKKPDSPEIKAHQFKPGNKLGGRTKGARNRLTEAFLNDVLAAWEDPLTGGPHVIERVKATDPAAFVRVVASILPKELTINDGDGALDKLIEGMNATELGDFIAGIVALGTPGKGTAKTNTAGTRSQSDIVH